MRPLLLVVLVDALGWRLAAGRPGFAPQLPNRREIGTILGFSSGALPTIFTGRMPSDHGRFLMYRRAGGDSVFAGLSWLRWLPARLRRSWRLTQWLTRRIAARGVRGYFNLYEVPRERLERFDLPEREDIFAPGGLPGGSIWDELDRSGLRWRGWNWRTPQHEAFAQALAAIPSGAEDVMFLYTAELDALLHREGSRGDGVGECLGTVERFIADAFEAAAKAGRPLWCHLISDHGMVDVEHTVDVQARLEPLGVRAGRDYEVFLDSTMARFGWRRPGARERVRAALGAEPRGRWLDQAALEAEGAWFADARYGDDLWLLEPGALVVPSFMGSRPVAAMHGYDPRHPDMTALLASNRPLPDDVRHLRDLRALLERECAALRAEAAA